MPAVFLRGNARDVLQGMPPDFIHCGVTSPPYFGLRKYNGGEEVWPDGWEGQLGGEPTPDLYIQHLVQIMREVRRVLRPDGVFWLNIGDSWAGSGKGQMGDGSHAAKHGEKQHTNTGAILGGLPKMVMGNGIKPLDMVLIPSLLALALREDGWYVRSEIVWQKNNPMPESVNGVRFERCKKKVDGEWQDCPGCPKCSPNDGYILRKGSWRPTDSHEIILMLTKTNHYFCDKEAVLEQGVYPAGEARQGGNGHKSMKSGSRTTEGLHNKEWVGNGGRNLRSVWQFPTKPGKFNHYAAYPPKLPEICLKSSTSEKGCCPKCGSPWARVVERGESTYARIKRETGHDWSDMQRQSVDLGAALKCGELACGGTRLPSGAAPHLEPVASNTIGWRPTCACDSNLSPIPCRVLDPFSGAGTTAMVAEQLGLDSFSIDTSAEYIQIAKDRIADDEQRRVDEQVKQLSKEARMVEREKKIISRKKAQKGLTRLSNVL